MNLRDLLLQMFGEEEEELKKEEKSIIKNSDDLEPGMHYVDDETKNTNTQKDTEP